MWTTIHEFSVLKRIYCAFKYKVTLQSEEIVSEECRKKSNQPMSSVHSHADIKDNCFFLKKTDVTLQIPVHITPTFVSDIST